MQRWLLWCFESCKRTPAHAAIFIVAEASQSMSDAILNWKMKSWMVTRVITWFFTYEHGVEASKVWAFVTHFINLFITTMLMPCTDVHSEAPMSHFLNRRVGMGCQALNFQLRANYVFKMSHTHACLHNVQHIWSPSPVENLPGLGQQCS